MGLGRLHRALLIIAFRSNAWEFTNMGRAYFTVTVDKYWLQEAPWVDCVVSTVLTVMCDIMFIMTCGQTTICNLFCTFVQLKPLTFMMTA